MKELAGVLLLAGYTSRSRAYVQALGRAGLRPQWIVLFGNESGNQPGQLAGSVKESESDAGPLFLPSMGIPVEESLTRLGWPFEILNARHIKEETIRARVDELAPKLVIFSGYGAQIVPDQMLLPSRPFLHFHSGWLPDYRGSTTLYYSWLRENRCGVSAIFLEKDIDTGPIVARESYPPPPRGVDPDHVYDAAIRADLLVKVMNRFAQDGRLTAEHQPKEGVTYYVIHPLLKHLARLRAAD